MLLGVDLGGTKIEAVALRVIESSAAPEIVARRRVPTPQERGYEAIVEATAALVESLAGEVGAAVKAAPLGVGMPGGVTRAGLVKNSNAVCLNGRPFRSDLEARLGRSIAFDNDANCFTLAEARFGAAAGYREGVVFGVIMGTGVGGGVCAFGRLWSGPQGIAGEWGHHAVWAERDDACYCGKRGCLELYASGPAVEAAYARRAGVGRPLAEIAARAGAGAGGEAGGDACAREAMEGLLEAFGRGLANVISILDPSAVVLGGGLSNLDALYEEGRARVARYVFNDELTTPILRNALGDSAGVLGAALLGAC